MFIALFCSWISLREFIFFEFVLVSLLVFCLVKFFFSDFWGMGWILYVVGVVGVVCFRV